MLDRRQKYLDIRDAELSTAYEMGEETASQKVNSEALKEVLKKVSDEALRKANKSAC